MTTIRVATLVLVLGGGMAAVEAQEAGHGADVPPFAELDADHDGYLTEAEASKVPAVAEVFAELDTDNDARLDADEYSLLAASN